MFPPTQPHPRSIPVVLPGELMKGFHLSREGARNTSPQGVALSGTIGNDGGRPINATEMITRNDPDIVVTTVLQTTAWGKKNKSSSLTGETGSGCPGP